MITFDIENYSNEEYLTFYKIVDDGLLRFVCHEDCNRCKYWILCKDLNEALNYLIENRLKHNIKIEDFAKEY